MPLEFSHKSRFGFALKTALVVAAIAANSPYAAAQDTSMMSTNPANAEIVVSVNPEDTVAKRNIESVLGLYEQMINQKDAATATQRYLDPGYIQHNPLLPTGAEALGKAFGKFSAERENLRVVVHRIIAVDNYVWAHVNFLNLLTDDPNDTGVAAVDIYLFNEDGKVIEHWDALQLVGTPDNAMPWLAQNIPAANDNGMF